MLQSFLGLVFFTYKIITLKLISGVVQRLYISLYTGKHLLHILMTTLYGSDNVSGPIKSDNRISNYCVHLFKFQYNFGDFLL